MSNGIDINEYAKWRDRLKSQFQKDFANYLEDLRVWRDSDSEHLPNINALREPDWSLQAYVEYLLESMPNQGR